MRETEKTIFLIKKVLVSIQERYKIIKGEKDDEKRIAMKELLLRDQQEFREILDLICREINPMVTSTKENS